MDDYTEAPSFKSKLKNAFISAVQSTFATSHLTLRYGIDVVEHTESMFMSRATGQDKFTTVKERRTNTILTRDEHKRIYNDIVENVKRKYSNEEVEVMNETEAYGNA